MIDLRTQAKQYLPVTETTQHWTKTPNGYALGGHTLTRSGKRWTLLTVEGVKHDLGTRASFDHAEAIIASACAA